MSVFVGILIGVCGLLLGALVVLAVLVLLATKFSGEDDCSDSLCDECDFDEVDEDDYV